MRSQPPKGALNAFGQPGDTDMLVLKDVHAYYGKSHVLHGVNFEVRPGEIVALLGRNGSGRSTTVKAIMGLVDGTGSVKWGEQQIRGRKPFEIALAGIGYVPEDRLRDGGVGCRAGHLAAQHDEQEGVAREGHGARAAHAAADANLASRAMG
mgnify:CR=1 FL=1